MLDGIRGGVILVVVDEAPVRARLRRQLLAGGHTVLGAGDGVEALHLVRRWNGAIDLVLSDAVLPRMPGAELASRVGAEFPGVPVLLMSGFDPAQLDQVVTLALQHPVSPPAGAGTPAV